MGFKLWQAARLGPDRRWPVNTYVWHLHGQPMPAGPREWLEEDGAFDDATTQAVVPKEAKARAWIEAKQDLVVAGLAEAAAVLEEAGCQIERLVEPGQAVDAGQRLAEIEGPARAVLAGERVALNLLMHLSGIATRTRAVVDAVEAANPRCQVLATRKTTPGLRALEHEAVVAGGGAPHREDLTSAVLIKENHLAFLTIPEAVQAARRHTDDLFVMVEAEDLEEATAVARAEADGVLLDNFPVEGLEDVVELLKQLKPDMVVEASGNLTLETVTAYAEHVDRVSLGSLTHSAPAADVSLRLEPET